MWKINNSVFVVLFTIFLASFAIGEEYSNHDRVVSRPGAVFNENRTLSLVKYWRQQTPEASDIPVVIHVVSADSLFRGFSFRLVKEAKQELFEGDVMLWSYWKVSQHPREGGLGRNLTFHFYTFQLSDRLLLHGLMHLQMLVQNPDYIVQHTYKEQELEAERLRIEFTSLYKQWLLAEDWVE